MSLHYGYCLLFLALTSITGCVFNPSKEPSQSQSFDIEITENDSKRFSLIIAINNARDENRRTRQAKPERQNGPTGTAKGGRNSGTGNATQKQQSQYQVTKDYSEDSGASSKEQVIAELNARLSETGYCRKGYFLLDYSQLRHEIRLLGECQESASVEDKLQW